MKNRVQLVITALLGFLLGASGSSAQENPLLNQELSGELNQDQTQNTLQHQSQDSELTESHTPISRREASDSAREAFEGRVLNVRLDGAIWRIRMDQEGNVFNVMVDANSGKVSRATE
jgi:uncharacterized membrane protein YkoI